MYISIRVWDTLYSCEARIDAGPWVEAFVEGCRESKDIRQKGLATTLCGDCFDCSPILLHNLFSGMVSVGGGAWLKLESWGSCYREREKSSRLMARDGGIWCHVTLACLWTNDIGDGRGARESEDELRLNCCLWNPTYGGVMFWRLEFDAYGWKTTPAVAGPPLSRWDSPLSETLMLPDIYNNSLSPSVARTSRSHFKICLH